jgi:hypothetical protein
MNIYPRLVATVTAMQGRVGPHPSLRYTVSQVLYQTAQDIDALTPPPPINVIHEEKNRHISEALTNLAGHLVYDQLYDQAQILARLQGIGEWVSEYILPWNCLCCCNGNLPTTVEVITDQHEIPWELTWGQGNFLAGHVIHARYPFVARARHHALAYHNVPRFAMVVGRSEGLFLAQAEIDEIRGIYRQRFGGDITMFQGETVTVDLLRNLLAATGSLDTPFDIIHFIGHGDSQIDQVWLELVGTPFLDHNVPSVIGGNPLVFWNACFGASSTLTRYRYQADVVDAFGGRLLSNGAGHFIGPLFPVLDSTAKGFAVSFYSRLFSGEPVGLAFFNAKAELSTRDPIAYTYVLYGNPAVRMVAND